MRRQTAINRLTKRAKVFFGLSLDQYLNQFTYFSESLGRMVMNENGTMQDCWYAAGMPTCAADLDE
tara:strand:- start:3778 stop:3975 length:198 start_codon:yes stop_codon:yes gene_type:complete